MQYVLTDHRSGNAIGAYATEAEALHDVIDAAHRYGRRSRAVLSLSLLRLDVPTEQGLVAEGSALVNRALQVAGLSESEPSHRKRAAT